MKIINTTSTTVIKKAKRLSLLVLMLLFGACFLVPEAVALQQDNRYSWANVYDDISGEESMFYKVDFKKKISLQLDGVQLSEALRQVAQEAGLKLAYRGDRFPQKKLTLYDDDITVSNALMLILDGTALNYMFSRDGHLVINTIERPFKEVSVQEEVEGTVTDAETGESLPGVNIIVKGTTTGTTTDTDGNYQLTVPSPNDTLVFSFVGFQTREVPIDGRSEINVQLQPQTYSGDELVVVGYGEQRREEITSAISSVQSEDFAIASARDAGAMIKGKVAGLSVTESSGDPTEDSEISLRGTISLMGSSDPLVLIDGVPGDLQTVSPEQVESVDVLKDGSAAAIYGSRGSNGVILITTKKNTRGQTSIQYDGYVDVQVIKEKPDFQSAEDYRQNISGDPQFEDFGYNTDWIDVVTRQPVSNSHTITYMGGAGENTSFMGSLNYKNTEGIFLRSDNENIIARTNLQHSMYDGQLQTDISLTLRQQNYWQQSDGQSFDGYVYRQALIRNPTDRIYNDDGNFQIRQGFNYDNPLILLEEQGGEVKNKELRLQGNVTWSPIETLSIELLGSTTRWVQDRGYTETHDAISSRKGGTNGFASIAGGSEEDDLLELTGSFRDTYGGHDVNVLGGYSYQQVANSSYYMSNLDFPTDLFRWHSIETGVGLPEGRAGMDSGKSSYKLIGFFGRVNYDWNNRYILMGSLRYEGSSRFGKDNKWGMFPAVSAGWRLSEEAFLSDVNWLNDLKLRAGFGVTGVVPTTPYESLASFSFGDNMFSGGEWIQGLTPSRNPNPNLKWERKEEFNVGLDYSVWDDRVNGSIEVYRRDSKDVLRSLGVPVPPNLFGSMVQNIGQIRNDGLEAMVNVAIMQESDFRWNSSVTYSTNRNELVQLTDEGEDDVLTTGGMDEPLQMPSHRSQVGGPIGDLIGFEAVDIDENGEWIVLDQNGNPIPIQEATPEDWRVLGNGIPDHNLAWNHSVRYRNFDMQLTMRGSFGFQISNWQRLYYENPRNTQYNMLNSAFHDVYGKRQLDYDLENVSYYVEDGDYWKIDNLTVGYTFDLDFIRSARVYLSGRNLLTFTGYKGLDPEVSTRGLTPGLDERDKYPTTRTYTIGVNLTF